MLHTLFLKKCAFVDSCIFSYKIANLVEHKLFQKLCAVITNILCHTNSESCPFSRKS